MALANMQLQSILVKPWGVAAFALRKLINLTNHSPH